MFEPQKTAYLADVWLKRKTWNIGQMAMVTGLNIRAVFESLSDAVTYVPKKVEDLVAFSPNDFVRETEEFSKSGLSTHGPLHLCMQKHLDTVSVGKVRVDGWKNRPTVFYVVCSGTVTPDRPVCRTEINSDETMQADRYVVWFV